MSAILVVEIFTKEVTPKMVEMVGAHFVEVLLSIWWMAIGKFHKLAKLTDLLCGNWLPANEVQILLNETGALQMPAKGINLLSSSLCFLHLMISSRAQCSKSFQYKMKLCNIQYTLQVSLRFNFLGI